MIRPSGDRPFRPERVRGRRSGGARRVLGRLVCAGSLIAAGALPSPVAAQESGPGGGRKWLGAAIGAVAVGVPTFASADFDPGLGTCTRVECFAPVATAIAFTLGFLLGKELDDAAARRFVAGPRVDLRPRRTVRLPFLPDRGRATGAGALLSGVEGLVLLEGATTTTLGGMRGLRDAVLVEERAAVVAATARGLFALPVARGGGSPGRRVDARGARRVAAGGGGERLVAAGAGGLVGFVGLGRGANVELSEATRATGGPLAADLVWPRASPVAWTLEGSRLVAREGTTLEEVGGLELSPAARALAVGAAVAVVAAGRDGVYVVAVSDPAAPRLAARYRGVRAALDVALLGSRAYVAAGEQGLVVLDLARPAAPEVAAVVGTLGSPSLVVGLEASEGAWVVDGATGEVHSVFFSGAAPPGG